MIIEIPITLINSIPMFAMIILSAFWFIVSIYERIFIILGIMFLIGAILVSGIIEFRIIDNLTNSTGFN